MSRHILVVDDEEDICDILQYNLETEGYRVSTAESAEAALLLMNCKVGRDRRSLEVGADDVVRPDLILLDVMMGEMSGFKMAQLLKSNAVTSGIPIIFVTALDQEDDTVQGLNLGADDYIAKPLSMREVKARVRAVLRRAAPEAKDTTHDDGIVIDDGRKQVMVDGREVMLTKIEFELISLLYSHANHVFSRDELLHKCWPTDTFVLDRTVDVNITRLRKKLGIYGKQIKTRFGYGYTFEK